MKKWIMLFLCALLLMPLSAAAEDLPDLLGAVSQGLSEGLLEGARSVQSSADELTLSLDAQDTRIEEGRTLLLTVTAGNPYPQATDVTLTLDLPQRLSCAQPMTWEAKLDAAAVDPVSGELVPSVSTFTREVTLIPGGGSEQAEIRVEMAMGTRFYRANTALDLCVPSISVSASVEGAEDMLVRAGDAFVYQIDVVNDGTAPKDVPIELVLPFGVTPDGDLPTGFTLKERTIRGAVRAEVAASSVILLPMRVDDDALSGDQDACRLMSGVLTADGKRVSLPMLKAVGPMISAKLIPQTSSLEQGEVMDLAITVVNTGLAAADVEISCLLPEGLTVLGDAAKATDMPEEAAENGATENSEEASDTKEEESGEAPAAALNPGDDAQPPAAAAEPVMAQAVSEPVISEEDGMLTVSLHMDAATESEGGLAAATQEVTLRVRADAPMENIEDRLLGATLAWRTDDGDTQLGEAVALHVYRAGLMGMSDAEWNGVLLAALLMMVTVCCLYSAVKADSKPDEYCFE